MCDGLTNEGEKALLNVYHVCVCVFVDALYSHVRFDGEIYAPAPNNCAMGRHLCAESRIFCV